MAQMCREFGSKMRGQDSKDSTIPTAVSDSLLLGFGVDTSAAAVTITNHPKSRIYINDTARLRYVAIAMKAVSATRAWYATMA